MTWLQLWEKIGKQPLKRTRTRRVTVYHKGMAYEARLKFTNNGNYFFLETGKSIFEEV